MGVRAEVIRQVTGLARYEEDVEPEPSCDVSASRNELLRSLEASRAANQDDVQREVAQVTIRRAEQVFLSGVELDLADVRLADEPAFTHCIGVDVATGEEREFFQVGAIMPDGSVLAGCSVGLLCEVGRSYAGVIRLDRSGTWIAEERHDVTAPARCKGGK